MKYGYFDNKNREYVIEKVDLPMSWTNYLGTEDLVGVVNHTAGGYLFYKSAEHHRITRFHANAVPMDRPGHYVYLRDDETGEYWTISWQPVGLPLDKANYQCRHGQSYTIYSCEYNGIYAEQKLFIPRGNPVELWDVKIVNKSGRPRKISVFSYAEFSYHDIPADNANFQATLYCAGGSYKDGIIEQDMYYLDDIYEYFASDFDPDSFDCVREDFIGDYRTEDNPIGVERGVLSGSEELGGNQAASLHKRFEIAADAEQRCCFMLGHGRREVGAEVKAKYLTPESRDKALQDLKDFWEEKRQKLQINTPNEDMNTMINIWNLYQAEVNIMFSRFASFIEVGGRTGLGYRDTAQDAMTVLHSNVAKCKQRIEELLRGLTAEGYGLHLFTPEWLTGDEGMGFDAYNVSKEDRTLLHGPEWACSDDALWLVTTIVEYIKETGDIDFVNKELRYADWGKGSVYEHMTKILDFSDKYVGIHGVCQGLRADWNDCLNLGGGESAMVSFLHYWALDNFLELAARLGKTEDVEKYTAMKAKVKKVCDEQLWDGAWYLRGFTKAGLPIGTDAEEEGKVHMECNTWAVLSGVADYDKGIQTMDSVYKWLRTKYGLQLNAPAYTKCNYGIGFVTRVYPGLKENGAIFSHPNPWAWCAEALLGRGDRAEELYNDLCPARQNDIIEIRQAEPYSYCQFIYGPDHKYHGRARHPFMTGSGGWSYIAVTRYMLGMHPNFDSLDINPCIPSKWDGFTARREWRGAVYNITVENPNHVCKGVKELYVNGEPAECVKQFPAGSTVEVKVVLG